MARTVEITGVGAYVPTAGSDRPRPYFKGATATVDEDVAASLVADGVAKFADAPEEAEGAQPLDDMDLRALKAFAAAEHVALGGATKKSDIRAAIDAALAERETSRDGEGAPDLAELDGEALLALAVDRDIDVPQDADREALLSLLADAPEEGRA